MNLHSDEEYKCPHGKTLFERCDDCAANQQTKVQSLPENYGSGAGQDESGNWLPDAEEVSTK